MKTKRFNMFCLPPAGSSASIYYSWKSIAPESIQIIPIEYSGHGSKIDHPLIDNPDQLAQQIAVDIQCDPVIPFILFGHSVGAGLLWSVLDHLDENTITQLKLMVISSRPEHSYIERRCGVDALTDNKIINELKRYNHFPEEILNHPQALAFFLKIIRNDFYISDQLLDQKIVKTKIPLMTFCGDKDPDIPNQIMMESWQQHTQAWLGNITLDGDHFYFFDIKTRTKMLDYIAQAIQKLSIEEAK